MFFRWIAGLMVWVTTYAVLTLLGFGKLLSRMFEGKVLESLI